MLFSLGSFLFIVSLRLRDILSMTIHADHHRRLRPGVDVLSGFRVFELVRKWYLSGAVAEVSHGCTQASRLEIDISGRHARVAFSTNDALPVY